MMEPEEHRDIIEQMAKRLREHTMSYKEGAWENFEAYAAKKSRRFVRWPYFSGAAAVLIMAVFFLLKNNQHTGKPTEVTEVAEVIQQMEGLIVEGKPEAAGAVPETTSEEPIRRTAASKTNAATKLMKVEDMSDRMIHPRENVETIDLPPTEKRETERAVQPMVISGDQLETVAEKKEADKVEPVSSNPPVTESFAQHLNNIQEGGEKIKINDHVNRKWNVGLEFSPTVSHNQLNVGGGVALAYSISSKLSVSSGISYVQLNAQRSPSMGGPSSLMNSPRADSEILNLGRPVDRKTLQSINSRLTGLDIPINFNYHLTSKMYVAAGVSLFNVLEENRVNEFKNELSEVAYASLSQKAPEPVIRTLYSTETVREKPYERNNVTGFLNLSVGYTIPLSKVVGFSLAPFIKLPMGNFSEQDMNLTNGGIKVTASF